MGTANPRTIRLAMAVVVLALAWMLVSRLIVAPVIESAYRGESLPLFNQVISGQALHPVEHYLILWEYISNGILIAFLLLGMVALIVTHPRFQQCVESWRGTLETGPIALPAKGRLRVVYITLAVVTGGSVFDIATGTEHWPFSNYPMYAGAQLEPSLTTLVLFGVSEGNAERELPLLDPKYIHPFDKSRLRTALTAMNERTDRDILLTSALRDCLERYEQLRRAERHQGPPLQAIRLYEVTWKLDPEAWNRDRPDRRELLFEVQATSKGPSE